MKLPLISPLFCLFALLLLAACASKPIVDTAGVDMEQYRIDYEECQQIANQVDTGEAVVASAGIGALIGAAFGLISGDAGEVAAWGAVTGGATGGMNANQEKSMVAKNCLYNRGYAVLN